MKSYLAITFLLLFAACDHPVATPIPPACSYSQHIQPIITGKCAISGCHGQNGLPNIADYNELKTRVDNGKVKLYVFDLGMMPPSGYTQLTAEEKDKLKCWLDGGAQQN